MWAEYRGLPCFCSVLIWFSRASNCLSPLVLMRALLKGVCRVITLRQGLERGVVKRKMHSLGALGVHSSEGGIGGQKGQGGGEGGQGGLGGHGGHKGLGGLGGQGGPGRRPRRHWR